MVIAILPVVFVVVGILLNALSANALVKDIGKAMYWAGFFVLAYVNAAKVISL